MPLKSASQVGLPEEEYDNWRKKLEESGFDDIESRFGNLKNPDIRTQGWRNQQFILDFHLRLDRFLVFYASMPKKERKIMELFTQGKTIVFISKELRMHRVTIHKVIRRYRDIVQAIHLMEIS